MKKSDLLFVVIVVAIFIPFVVFEPLYEGYKAFNASHGMVMSFLKFEIFESGFRYCPSCGSVGDIGYGNQSGDDCICQWRTGGIGIHWLERRFFFYGRSVLCGKGAGGFLHFGSDEQYFRTCIHDVP